MPKKGNVRVGKGGLTAKSRGRVTGFCVTEPLVQFSSVQSSRSEMFVPYHALIVR